MKKPNERKTIGDLIQDQIELSMMQQKTPEKVTIKKINSKHRATIETDIDEITMQNILCIGGNLKAGATGVLFYLEGDELIVIT